MLATFNRDNERNGNFCFGVLAFLSSRLAASSTTERIATATKHSTEDVVEIKRGTTAAAKSLKRIAPRSAAACSVAELVVALSLGVVTQDIVRLGDFREFLLSIRIRRLHVRMEFLRQLLVSLANLIL